jgi:Cyclic nucleotide-binding domain
VYDYYDWSIDYGDWSSYGEVMWSRRTAPLPPLSRFPPFDRCRPKALAPLTAHVDHLRLPAGTVLAHEGWTVREVICVVTGEVIATRRDREPQRHGPGSQIGVAELLCGASHPATLTAGDDLEVLVIYGPAYRWAAQTLPAAQAGTGPDQKSASRSAAAAS